MKDELICLDVFFRQVQFENWVDLDKRQFKILCITYGEKEYHGYTNYSNRRGYNKLRYKVNNRVRDLMSLSFKSGNKDWIFYNPKIHSPHSKKGGSVGVSGNDLWITMNSVGIPKELKELARVPSSSLIRGFRIPIKKELIGEFGRDGVISAIKTVNRLS